MSEFLFDESGQLRESKYRGNAANGRRADSLDAVGSSGVDGGSDQHAAQQGGSIRIRPRTKYEQAIMDRIPERQKATLQKQQVVGGRVYTGVGFLPNPARLEFLDFAVGETIKQTVQLTNVSSGFNAFKVLPPPPLFRDVLEVVYEPQSMMSAGMSCTITVIFTPKDNVDIDTELTVFAQTGTLTIPVACRRKRVVISSSTSKLDFGSIVVAESASQRVVLRNDGALGVKMTIAGDIIPLLQTTHTDTKGVARPVLTMEPEINLSKPTVVTLRPFSTTTIALHFSPMQLCTIDSNIYLSFDNNEVDDVVIFVTGRSVDVPVFVSYNSILDFSCCFYDTLYRDKVTVQNTLGSAVKVSPEVPPCLKGMLEYVPKFGFVQPNSSFDFQVKLLPNEGLGSELDVPVRIVVSEQAMPIFFQAKASLSKRQVVFDPPELQFGVCSIGEMLQLPLKVTNHCRIARRLGFVKLPHNVKVTPEQVFEIGPQETQVVQVAVAPPTQGQFTQTLQLATEHDETYSITVTGHGKSQVLSFSDPMVKLPVCTVGGSSTATTLLTNRSNIPQRFSFTLLKSYGVTVSPMNGVIEKGQSVPIVITYHATHDNVEMELPPFEIDVAPSEAPTTAVVDDGKGGKGAPAAAAQKKKLTKAEEEQERKEKERLDEERRLEREKKLAEREKLQQQFSKMERWECSKDDEVWSRHRTLLVPAHIDGWSGKAVMLGVRCSVVRPTVVASLPVDDHHTVDTGISNPTTARSGIESPRKSVVSKSVPSGSITLNYGDVPADRCVKRTISIQNVGDKIVHLSVKPLDPFGPFKISRPPLSLLKPKHQCEVGIEFTPTSKAVYAQTIVIQCVNGNSVTINAIGEGLPAALSISLDKANPHSGANSAEMQLPMGYCLVNDKSETPLFFTNLSPFPLQVTASFMADSVLPFNPNGAVPFYLFPNKFTVPANGKVDAVAVFAPGLDGPYQATCEVEFGGDRVKKILKFEGFGSDRGLQVVFPPHEQNKPPRGFCTQFGDLPPIAGSSSAAPVLINFSSTEQKPTTQQVITIVNVKGSTQGDFTVEGLTDADMKNGWKVDPVKANVAPATKALITITFTPTPLLMDSLPIPNVSVVSLCNLRLVLKGGAPATDSTVNIRCKGTVCR